MADLQLHTLLLCDYALTAQEHSTVVSHGGAVVGRHRLTAYHALPPWVTPVVQELVEQ